MNRTIYNVMYRASLFHNLSVSQTINVSYNLSSSFFLLAIINKSQQSVRAVTLENLVSVHFFFGNQPVGLSSRDAQLAETTVFWTKSSEILKISIFENCVRDFLARFRQSGTSFWFSVRFPKPRNPGTGRSKTLTRFSSDTALTRILFGKVFRRISESCKIATGTYQGM